MQILNLGSGNTKIKDAISVDKFKHPWVDYTADLEHFPWPWENNSVDGIYMIHSIEHFKDFKGTISECYRILKPGGFLHIHAPHSSSVSGIGCIGHHKTFSYNTFDDYLTKPDRLFTRPPFKTQDSYMNYFGFKKPKWFSWEYRYVCPSMVFLKPLDYFMGPIINFCPPLFEKLTHYWIGGASEIVWRGTKL